jgi:predicted metal-binding membrane protein
VEYLATLTALFVAGYFVGWLQAVLYVTVATWTE